MKNDLNGLIFCGFILILLICLGLMLRSGHGAFLISWYNIMPKRKKEQYNEKLICRSFGNLLLAAALYLLIVIIAGILEATWLIILLTTCFLILCIGITIYIFTSEKFRN